jgi:hypothetical protein
MDRLDAHLLDRILDDVFTWQNRTTASLTVCKEWRDSAMSTPQRLAAHLVRCKSSAAFICIFSKAFSRGCAELMREVVKLSAKRSFIAYVLLDRALLEGGAALDGDVVREFLRVHPSKWCCGWAMVNAVVAAVDVGRIDLATMIAARAIEIDADPHQVAEHALTSATSAACFRHLREIFPDAPSDPPAINQYMSCAIKCGDLDFVSLLLAENTSHEIHHQCLMYGMRNVDVVAMVLAAGIVQDIPGLLFCAAYEGHAACARLLVTSRRAELDADAIGYALNTATGDAVATLLEVDDAPFETLMAAARNDWYTSAKHLMTVVRDFRSIKAARKVAIENDSILVIDEIAIVLRRSRRSRRRN